MKMPDDIKSALEELAVELKWDLFELLSNAWYGKGCYFRQDDGTVYSRVSCQYMTFAQAIDEFADRLAAE